MQKEADKTPIQEDAATQALILRRVLEDQPTRYQLIDLTRALDLNPECFSELDVIRRGVADLVRGGLLYKVGDLVLPSAPAVYFHSLPIYR